MCMCVVCLQLLCFLSLRVQLSLFPPFCCGMHGALLCVQQVADIGSSDATVLNAAQLEQMELQQEEEDEELKRWEMQQIRKGATAAGAGQQSVPTHAQLKQAVAKPTTAATAAQRETLAQAILGTTAKVTVDEVQKKLKAALAVVTDKHSVHSKQFNHSRTTVENARKAVDELDVQYAKRSENFLFYSELRDYILDLCDCLASKVCSRTIERDREDGDS